MHGRLEAFSGVPISREFPIPDFFQESGIIENSHFPVPDLFTRDATLPRCADEFDRGMYILENWTAVNRVVKAAAPNTTVIDLLGTSRRNPFLHAFSGAFEREILTTSRAFKKF